MRPQQSLSALVLVAVAAGGCSMRPQPDIAPAMPYGYKLAAATFLGGREYEQAREVIVAPDGSVLVGGMTMSSDLATTEGALQPRYAGDDPATGNPGTVGGDAFLVRVNATLSTRLAATYLGGSRQERGVYGMARTASGDIVIVSATRSHDMPTTPRAVQPRFGGGENDAYVARISADLRTLRWGTYVGASGTDWPRGGLAIDTADNVYVVGQSDSPDFPITEGAWQRDMRGKSDAVILAVAADGSRLLFSTRLGGSATEETVGVRVDAGGRVVIGGYTTSDDFPMRNAPQARRAGMAEGFVATLSGDGKQLLSSTYIGGRGNEFAEHHVAIGPDGSVLFPGVTSSPDFPVTPGALGQVLGGTGDGFLARLSADGRQWNWSARIGGSGGDAVLMPAFDSRGNILFVGSTSSRDFPVTPDALQATFGGGPDDGVFGVLSGDGTRLLYATYLGGSGSDIVRSLAIAPDGAVYLVGGTDSRDFPATSGSLQAEPGGKADAFMAKLTPRGQTDGRGLGRR